MGISAAVTLVAVAALLPVALTTSAPFVMRSGTPPAWFDHTGRHLDDTTVVLVVPFAGQQAMGWQAQADLGFRLAGGFAVVPGPSGRSEFVVPPTGAAALLTSLSPPPASLTPLAPPTSARDVAEVRAALHRWGVDMVVVAPQARAPRAAVAFFDRVIGHRPTLDGRSWVWSLDHTLGHDAA